MARPRTCDCGSCRKCQKRAAQWRYVRGIKIGRKDALTRFWAKVDKSGPMAPELGSRCWMWLAYKDELGYGRFSLDGRARVAHAAAYELLVGPVSEELSVDHLCRNTSCVNPAHFELVDIGTNIRRGFSVPALNARKTHCKRGHEFSETNTRIAPSGQRRCRTCERERSAARRA